MEQGNHLAQPELMQSPWAGQQVEDKERVKAVLARLLPVPNKPHPVLSKLHPALKLHRDDGKKKKKTKKRNKQE